ncbi:MAG: hypothetical protein CVV23_02780 [Ignavibacteriae bacterium HGW-Ignavibacteriae-2]|jgi:hypothetical protein|nr:hypothetical protein [Bacteroidota bacterium]PKL89974.1 MAG: hypothetical protein CVV23_02780 [Ignavibacteriae bacterium HGW-Ignavibacteriae-2]
MDNQEKRFQDLISNKPRFFQFMNERYPVFKNSNIFLRDIQFAIRTYFERKNVVLSYSQSEELMERLTSAMENEKELVKLSNNAWKVNFNL